MSKVALAAALALLLFFTFLTAIRPAYAFAYALCLLFIVAWAWPRVAIRGMTFTRRLDPGTPTVGESYEEAIEVRRKGWVPAPWVEVRDLSQIPDYQPGRVISVSGEVVKWKARGVFASSARALRPLRKGAQAHAANLGARVSAGHADSRPADAQCPAGGELAKLRRVGRLSARDRRRPRLHDGRQLRPHPLAALGPARQAHVEDFRTTAHHRPLDPARPRPQRALGRGRGIDSGVRGEPCGVDGLAGPQPRASGWTDRQ